MRNSRHLGILFIPLMTFSFCFLGLVAHANAASAAHNTVMDCAVNKPEQSNDWIAGSFLEGSGKNQVHILGGNTTPTLSGDSDDFLRSLESSDFTVNHRSDFPIFPVSQPTYLLDNNLGSILDPNIMYAIPAFPKVADTPECVPRGIIGVLNDGLLLPNPRDIRAPGIAQYESHERCLSHPNIGGMQTTCIPPQEIDTIGYAIDGFPITGSGRPDGSFVPNTDLDQCHGETSPIMLDGNLVTTYHYVINTSFPFSIGCLRSTF